MFPNFAAMSGVAHVHDAESVYVTTSISGYQNGICRHLHLQEFRTYVVTAGPCLFLIFETELAP